MELGYPLVMVCFNNISSSSSCVATQFDLKYHFWSSIDWYSDKHVVLAT